MAVVKKQRSYSIDFKIKIFEEIDAKRLSKSEICKKYDIPNLTLSAFLKNRTEVKGEKSSANRSRKRLREAAYSDINEALSCVCSSFLVYQCVHMHIYIYAFTCMEI